MRCCVPGCKNDSRHISKSQGITFHVFPTEPTLRSSWLRALGKESWEPKERSAVCSEHFLCEDLYETKSGLRKVRPGAVPIVQDASCDYGEANTLQVCRICLAVDGRLLSIRKYRLEEAYHNLTGLECEDKLPGQLCVECAHRLLNSSRLRNKSLRAHSIMMEIVSRQDILTLQNLATINRDNNRLTSNLGPKHYEPNFYNQVLDHDTIEDKEIPLYEVNIADEIVIKNENNDFNDDNDMKEENNEINDYDNDNDVDFVASDREYSTDDSLPLEARRRKKEKVKKNKIEKKEAIKKVRKRQVKKDPTQPKIDRRRKPFLNDELNETLFTITDLTQDEQLEEIRKRQETANYKNSVFKCEACFKGFLDEDAYNSHIIRHTDQCGEYECNICKTHFKHPHALRKHITAHHTQRFSCNQCPYVTTHRQTARLHERWHKGTKYQCPHCQDEFVKFTTYMGHIRIKHPSDFVCQLCGYSFVSEKGIELHKKLKHRLDDPQIPEDGPFCELCNVRFVSNEALRRHVHVSARHAGSDKDDKDPNKSKRPRKPREPNVSRERRRSRSTSSERRRYPSQLRKAEGPIPCEQCGMQLEDSRAYHGHFRRMHPDKNRTNYPSMKSPCMCEVCGRMFQSYALLKDHTWTHTGERPFKCDSCGKSFRMKQRLVAHRRVHSAQRATYVCSVCGKHFSTHSNRQRHMFIHTGLKPFKCEMCGKCFKHASEKRAHITYVHLKKPWPKRARGKRRDSRQSMQHPQMSVGTSASEMDIVQPLWPSCDPKLADINAMMDDKPMYYNLKI
ncbi:zinc finger protein 479-like [Cydia fagiglandana]|uniref:zinc finger protein 479-like n=1 Tax=Cydia fagiglandana TaxID=1458189 RepID=UPI002FEE2A86